MRVNIFIVSWFIFMAIILKSVNALDEQIISQDDEAVIAHMEMLETMDALSDENIEVVEQEEVVD